MRFVISLGFAAVAQGATLVAPDVVPLFDFQAGSHEAKAADVALDQVMQELLQKWHLHGEDSLSHWLSEIKKGSESFLESKAATAYKTVADQPLCDVGVAPAQGPGAISAYPGGVSKRLFGFDLAKMVDGLAQKAQGPAAASSGLPMMLAMQSLVMGSNVVKAMVSSALQVVPPLIPPPVWNNQPLPCLPMVTGHNCFGAVLYPITAADSIMADVTDAQLDGTIAGFPGLYANKVGKTSDDAYRACFSAYMSLQCASIFPMCATAQSHDFAGPAGRLPLCFFHCIAPLVMCPGFWIEDIGGECMMASVPPQCTTAVFMNFHLLPPQYESFEDSVQGPLECPMTPQSLSAMDASHDFGLYSATGIEGSAYGNGVSKLPVA